MSQPMTCVAWLPDGQSFVAGSLDKTEQLCEWDLQKNLLHSFKTEHRVQDCAISRDGRKLVFISNDNHIVAYNLLTRELDYTIQSAYKMTCISISRDCRHLLVSLINHELYLYNLRTGEFVRKFEGKLQGRFIIRSGFGGSDESLIVSGSEGMPESWRLAPLSPVS